MKKPPTHTTQAMFRSLLRSNWLRSPERKDALKRTGYCCERCGVKQSKAKDRVVKINVHHPKGVNLDKCYAEAKKEMFVPSDDLEVLCVSCHDEEHGKKTK